MSRDVMESVVSRLAHSAEIANTPKKRRLHLMLAATELGANVIVVVFSFLNVARFGSMVAITGHSIVIMTVPPVRSGDVSKSGPTRLHWRANEPTPCSGLRSRPGEHFEA